MIIDRISSNRKLVKIFASKIWKFFNAARFRLYSCLLNPSARLVAFSSALDTMTLNLQGNNEKIFKTVLDFNVLNCILPHADPET
jgi:hypothetical protein